MKRAGVLCLCVYILGCGKPEGIEPCAVCGGDVAIKAEACPHCGLKNPSPTIRARIEAERKDAIAEAKREAAELKLFTEQEKARPIEATYSIMHEASEALIAYAAKNKKLPDELTAREIVFPYKDAWGFSLLFEYRDAKAGKYRLRSNGGEGSLIQDFILAPPRP